MCGTRYTCEACGESILTDDDAPVCPDCGAPMTVDPVGMEDSG